MEIVQNKAYKLSMTKLQIIDAYKSGKSCYEIAKKCKCTPQNIFMILKKTNTPRRTLSEAMRKYTCDEKYFMHIDTEEKAYFLGLLYADGNVHKKVLSISLQEEDKHILEYLKKTLQYTGPITTIKKKDNRKQQFDLSITSQILVDDLSNHGLYPCKSTSLIFPITLVPELTVHFIRGYFDGDGCVYVHPKTNDYLFSIVGPLQFLEIIQNIFIKEIGLNKTKLYNPKNCKVTQLHVLTYQGKQNLLKIRNWLYANTTCYLNRKYTKFYSF